ncbi:RNA-directed DNA polymerase [Candidatus Parcubacteria bacterium]|nr:MAG: RNA-directed DNA polymerase [Candidatus Parcubacteria bacterium]
MNSLREHRKLTRKLARSLKRDDVYFWLLDHGYFPEAYVLPPCFRVVKRPEKAIKYFDFKKKSKRPSPKESLKIHFPKSDLLDRTFGIIDPAIHNDIAYHISRNCKAMVDAMVPEDSLVTSFSFPLPITKKKPGRIGVLRSGRMIYEFISMTDDILAKEAYKYSHIVRADIKNFYPSIYTHSIAWAIHGKRRIRNGGNRYAMKFVGNRLDKLFQCANDGCTNGIPIGPVVSDIVGEIIAAAIDRIVTREVRKRHIKCAAARFKDDYRILVDSESNGKEVIKILQAALKEYNLELGEGKTSVYALPDVLFRPWVSRYHLAYPRNLRQFSWKEFRELYLAVLDIRREFPDAGVVDRFLADISSSKGQLKISVSSHNLEKVMSMLLLLGPMRQKAFPKILAILENIICSKKGDVLKPRLIEYLDDYLGTLAKDEERNQYLISWLVYFLASNRLLDKLKNKPKLKLTIPRRSMTGRGIFTQNKDFKLVEGILASRKRASMFQHLDIFNPPKKIV